MDVVPETQAMQDVLDPRFSIQSPLRCYGPGSLDRGQDTVTNSRIAIRWLPVDAGGESASLKVSQLPLRDALPRVHAKGKVGSLAYFAMDFPEGKLLAGMLGAPLEIEKILRIGIDIADALATVHELGMVHGELSPHSILFANTGKAMLWDVPLVVADRLTERRGEDRSLAKLGRIVSSMAPECARGLLPTPASDIYSLAALLCRASGDGIPQGGTTLAKVHEIGSGRWNPEPPHSLPMALRVVLSLACNSEPATRPAAAVFAAQLRDIYTDFKKTPLAPRDGKNGHDAKNGNGVSLLKKEVNSAATFKIEIPKVEMPKRMTPPPATKAEPMAALKVDMPTAPALPPAPPAEHMEDPVTSPQPIPAVIPFDTAAEAKAEEGEAEMVSSSAAELISGTSEILSGATEVNETVEAAAPPPPPAEASEPSAEVAADGELKLPSSLPSGFPEGQSSLPSAFPDAPEGEVQLKLAAPSNEAFLIPSGEMAEESASGNVFGVATGESTSKWKSPVTWLGLAVAVILPVTILVIFLTTKSHPAKSAEPAAPSLAATPAPETPKAVEPEPAPAPAEAKMTKTVAKAPKAKALPVAAAPKAAAKAPKAAPAAKASSDETPAPKAAEASAKSSSAKSADGAFDDESPKSDGARKPVTARAPAATGATN